ncbi:uncharacterized protein LOC134289825 [Aedes albopictus]|uniref:PHD-type domain-containing protein n=1 Tax=Aedes albopictus TaxID=7160 RepID=A0ABM1XYL9_AEDAL
MEEHRKPGGYSCKSCTRPDTDDEKWVACDRCKLWEHFECAGVSESVKNRRYLCKECELTVAAPTASTSRSLRPPPSEGRSLRSSTAKSGLKPVNKVTTLASKFSRSANSTTSSTRAARLEAQMKLVEEEQVLKEQELEAQEAMRRKEMEEEERRLEERKALLEEEARLRQRKLQEEKEYQKRQQVIRMESLEKRNTIARQLSACSSKSESIPDSEQQIALWLQQCSPEPFEDRISSLQIDAGEGAEQLVQDQPPSTAGQRPSYQRPRANQDCQEPLPSERDNIETQQDNHDVFRSRFNGPTQPPLQDGRTSVSRADHARFRDANMPYQQNPGSRQAFQPEGAAFHGALSPSQLAARQVMGKELPNFTGNPEDWPIFICSFEQSTSACGYSDAENLMRLQRCLKGQAYESVRSRLLLPSSVPQVINTLRTLYGRPELLIRTLIEKVRCAAAPRHDRLESVVEFGLVVQNLVDHLKAAKQYTHLSNPVLMQELVEKLPGSLKLDWAVYRSRQPYATLATFGDFMTGLLDAASQVTYELPNATRNFKGEQRRTKEKGHINAHSATPASSLETSSSSPKLKRAGKTCAACEREGHRVAECRQFKSLGHDERWKVVQGKGLCSTCLNSHGKWPCRTWQGCDIAGCREKHHTLLHPSTLHPSLNVSVSNITQNSGSSPMFRVLPVVLHAGERKEVLFAFIDEGSSTTLLEKTVADRLGVSGPVEPLTLQWTGKVTREERMSQRLQLKISGEGSSSLYKLCEVRTVGCLVLPTQSMKYNELCDRYPHLRGLPLKDYELIQPKLLIGLDNLHLAVPLKVREGGTKDPIAAKCRLGWSVYGYLMGSSTSRAVVHFHVAAPVDSDRQLNDQLRDYFALEDAGVTERKEVLESDEERRARTILQLTTRRTHRGFETGLLWRDDDPVFPDSYSMAVRRLKALEKKTGKGHTVTRAGV